MTHAPHGVGVYIRALGPHLPRSPEQTALVAADHGLRFAPILACWQQGSRGKYSQRGSNDPTQIARYAEALAAVGVQPGIWFYPWAGHEDELLAHLAEVLRVCDGTIRGLVPDPELGYKWRRSSPRPGPTSMGSMRGQPEAISGRGSGDQADRLVQARTLMGGLVDLMDESMWLLVTSYGIARFHRNFPWEIILGYGALSPQLYGASPREARRGLLEWGERADDPGPERQYLPSIATYGPTAQWRLASTLSAWDDLPISGMVAWSWPQTSDHEWGVLQEWSERI